jgi:hypothetical protein
VPNPNAGMVPAPFLRQQAGVEELMVWYRDIRLSAQPHNRIDLRLAFTPEDAPAADGRCMAEVKHVLVTRQ